MRQSPPIYLFLNDDGEIQARRGLEHNADEIVQATKDGFVARLEFDADGELVITDHCNEERVEIS